MIERYPVEQSGFFHLRTQRALAQLLRCDKARLKKLVASRDENYWFKEEEINGKIRKIQCPYGKMRSIHERIKSLFNRVGCPNYLHAPRHGSSYITNARVHMDSNNIASLVH